MKFEINYLGITRSLLVVTCILICGSCLISCNKKIEVNEQYTAENKGLNLADHIKFDERPILIYTIDKWTCFRCGPLYWNSVELVLQVDTSKINMVLVFQYMREIDRKKFLKNNFGINIDSNRFQIIYNDRAYSKLLQKYGKKQSFVLGFNQLNEDPIFVNQYQVGVYEEIVQFVNNADTLANLVVADYMWY